MISMVKKLNKLSSKKVQLILTDKPKLVYVNPSKLALKKNIMWSDDPTELFVHVATSSHFKVITVNKVSAFQSVLQSCCEAFVLDFTCVILFSQRKSGLLRMGNKGHGNGRRQLRVFKIDDSSRWSFLTLTVRVLRYVLRQT